MLLFLVFIFQISMLSSHALLWSGRSESRKIRNGYEMFSWMLWNCLNKNAQVHFVINFPISICLYLLQIKIKISWKKITIIREGEWRIHRKMSQWLWNPSSLKFGMNLLAATPSCDNEMQHPVVTDYSQLWQWAATLVVTASCNTQLWLCYR